MKANLSSLQTKIMPIIFGLALFVVAFSAVKGMVRGNLADVKMYTKLANAEIPQCAFEESANQEYNYYIFSDGTVLCDCPECIEAIKDALD
jgi:hypothetical protein